MYNVFNPLSGGGLPSGVIVRESRKRLFYFGPKNSNDFFMLIVVYYKQDAIKSENRDDVTETLSG